MSLLGKGESVTILAPTSSEDDYGNTVDSWATPTTVATVTALVEPRPNGETFTDDRNAITSGYTLYMPAGTPVTALHRVLVRGSVWNVLGQPAVWEFGQWEPGVVVQVGRTDG